MKRSKLNDGVVFLVQPLAKVEGVTASAPKEAELVRMIVAGETGTFFRQSWYAIVQLG